MSVAVADLRPASPASTASLEIADSPRRSFEDAVLSVLPAGTPRAPVRRAPHDPFRPKEPAADRKALRSFLLSHAAELGSISPLACVLAVQHPCAHKRDDPVRHLPRAPPAHASRPATTASTSSASTTTRGGTCLPGRC